MFPQTPANNKLKLFTKKLQSGKIQVRFEVMSGSRKGCYGYVLVKAEDRLKDVVYVIQSQITHLPDLEFHYHQHLYSLKREGMIDPIRLYKMSMS